MYFTLAISASTRHRCAELVSAAVGSDPALQFLDHFISSASSSFTAAPQISYPFAIGCSRSARNVSGRK